MNLGSKGLIYDNDKVLCSANYAPDTVNRHVLTHFILITTLWDRYSYPHLVYEEMDMEDI